MEDTAKYLIHADVAADGIVERSDVVGAVFGQTEGLLGEDLDLRDLQQSSKVGRIDVEIESEGGRSYGTLRISSTLDRVETAILAASLETIDRIGPCQAVVDVSRIEDVRGAKRRAIVDRAKELLATAFEEDIMDSDEIFEEVRESVRVERITDYAGLPAGPRVEKGDAIIVVEGRADVTTLLKYGVKNAVAVEGTSIPDAVADLTRERTTTVFLDGDRGGDLILRELAQVGEVDYVASAPEGRSVENLARHEILSALRDKVPYDVARARFDAMGDEGVTVADATGTDPTTPATETSETSDGSPATMESEDATETTETTEATEATDEKTTAATDGSTIPAPDSDPAAPGAALGPASDLAAAPDSGPSAKDSGTEAGDGPSPAEPSDAPDLDENENEDEDGDENEGGRPTTLPAHVREFVGRDTGAVRLLDADFSEMGEGEASAAVATVADADPPPATLVVDGPVTQRLLDVAAQRGVAQVVGTATGDFTKQPTSVRIRLAEDVGTADA